MEGVRIIYERTHTLHYTVQCSVSLASSGTGIQRFWTYFGVLMTTTLSGEVPQWFQTGGNEIDRVKKKSLTIKGFPTSTPTYCVNFLTLVAWNHFWLWSQPFCWRRATVKGGQLSWIRSHDSWLMTTGSHSHGYVDIIQRHMPLFCKELTCALTMAWQTWANDRLCGEVIWNFQRSKYAETNSGRHLPLFLCSFKFDFTSWT